MKGLNVKRLATIGVGAALVGSAMAPMVFGAFDGLTKDKVINATTGDPLVSVVVGSNAAVSDAVWAGNIAAKVANMANTEKTVDFSCGAGAACNTADAKVMLSVGGTVHLSSGARELNSNNLSSTSGSVEYYEAIGNAYFKQFKSETRNMTLNGVSSSISIVESVGVKADGRFNTEQNIKDLVAEVASSDMNYTVAITPGISNSFTDTGNDDYIPISFLGNLYSIDSVTSSSVVLIKEGSDRLYNVGDQITLRGRDGSDYKIRFDGGATISGGNVVANVGLLDAQDNLLQTQQFDPTSGSVDIIFRTAGGQEILQDKVRLLSVGSSTQNNSTIYTFKVIVGSDRVELRQGREVPYDPNSTGTSKPWVANLTYSSGLLTQIAISNNNYQFVSDNAVRAVQALYPDGKPNQFVFFDQTGIEQVGTFKFQGFYEAGVQKSTVSFLRGTGVAQDTSANQAYGAIHYFDASGNEHYIPMAMRLTTTNGLDSGSSFVFDGVNHAYATNTTQTPTVFSLDTQSTDGDLSDGSADYTVTVLTGDTNADASAIVLLEGRGKNTPTYKYLVRRSTNTSTAVYLVLVGYNVSGGSNYNGYIDSMQYNTGDLFFLGTAVNDGNVTNSAQLVANDFNLSAAGAKTSGVFALDKRPYYYPDLTDYNGNSNTGSGGSNVYMTAAFRVREAGITGSSSTIPADGAVDVFEVYIDTEGGNSGTVDTAGAGGGGKTGYAGYSTAARYVGAASTQSLNSFSEWNPLPGEGSSNYAKAFTDVGSKVILNGRELWITMPNQRMKAYFTVEGTDVQQEVVGGEDLEVMVGSTGTAPSGAKVTVTGITGVGASGAGGACTANPAAAVTPYRVGQLVFTDRENPAGSLVIVGGHMVNNMAKNLSLADGTSLEAALTAPGDFEAQMLGNGDFIVAGYTADDTGRAAQMLIDALDGLMVDGMMAP